MIPLSSIKNNLDSLLAAAAGFVIIYFYTRHGGIGIEPDSVVYLTTAENLHTNGRLADFTNGPLVDFPAFYPGFLSGMMFLTGLNPLTFAPILNAILFALVIYMAGYMMQNFTYRSRWYKVAILSCIVISPCLLEDYSMLMSESLFIVLLLLFFILIHRYFQSYSRLTLSIAAIVVSLASITRYAGIAFIGAGGLLLLLDRSRTLRRKTIDIIIFTCISLPLLVINLRRNYFLGGTMTGGRERSVTSLHENMHDAGSVFYDWLPFLQGHYKGALLFFILVIVVIGALCSLRLIKAGRLTSYEDLAASFSFVYLLFIVIVASISRFETLNSRFLSPVFIPLLWTASSWLIKWYRSLPTRKRIGLLAGATLAFFLFQYGQLAADYETWDGVKDAGIPGYTEDQWRYSQTVLFFQKDSLPFKSGYTIYSNANDAVYFFTRKPGKFLPHKLDQTDIKDFLNDPHCYVVWFDDGENPDLVDKKFITNNKKMKLLKQFNDGAIYGYDQ